MRNTELAYISTSPPMSLAVFHGGDLGLMGWLVIALLGLALSAGIVLFWVLIFRAYQNWRKMKQAKAKQQAG